MGLSRQVAVLMALLALTASALFAEEWSRTYPVTGKPELQVLSDDSNVRITGSTRSDIAVRVTTEGWKIVPPGGNATGARDELRVYEEATANKLRLEFKTPRYNVHIGWSPRRSISVEISVPRELLLDVRTGDGHIDLRDVRGELKLVSGDGHITGEGLDGKLRVHTGDGHIRVNGRFDQVQLGTGDGRIEAGIASGSKVADGWRIVTGDGSVTLRLPGDLAADLDAHTGDGRISLDLPVTVSGAISSHSVRGKLNSGGNPLYIRTGDGSIRLERGGTSM